MCVDKQNWAAGPDSPLRLRKSRQKIPSTPPNEVEQSRVHAAGIIKKRGTTVERLYCKRSIQCLASSKILTLHAATPSPPGDCECVLPPSLVRGEDTLAGWGGEWGVNILEDARHCSVLCTCGNNKHWDHLGKEGYIGIILFHRMNSKGSIFSRRNNALWSFRRKKSQFDQF